MHFVQDGPGHQHSHDDGLSGPACHLAAAPFQVRATFPAIFLARQAKRDVRSHAFCGTCFRKPDHGFRGFALGEEELSFPVRAAPVSDKLLGNTGCARIALLEPRLHARSNVVHDIEGNKLYLEQ
jgi:hypothetical protein